MIERMRSRKVIVLLTVLCLAAKVSGLFTFDWWNTNGTLMIWMSVIYYLLLGALCFCGGLAGRSTVVLAGALSTEVLVAVLWCLKAPEFLTTFFFLTITSHSAALRLLEAVGLNGWPVFGALAALELLFLGIHWLGKIRSAR